MELATLMAIGELFTKYGVPTALSIIAAWRIEGDPTKEDIDRLRTMVPEPGTYFKEE